MWHSLPDGYTLAAVLLKEGPAILGCFLLAADVAQLLGGFIPTLRQLHPLRSLFLELLRQPSCTDY